MPFLSGHGLIIGVGQYNNIPGADVPIAASDAQAVAGILQDDRVCGYPAEQVHLLLNGNATREKILTALQAIGEALGEDDTLLLFYCGHGAAGEDGSFYFVSHDAQVRRGRVVAGTGVRDAEFIDLLRKVKARRMLVVLNTCFSGMVSPSLDLGSSSLEIQHPPEDTHSAILATGSGRVIITAAGEDQKSWIGRGAQSIFTQAFTDGLQGKGVANRGGTISVFDLYTSIFELVSEKVAEEIDARQEPELTVLKGVGPFPVSLYRGATVLGEFDANQPAPSLPTVRKVTPEKAQKRLESYLVSINTGGGAAVFGDVNVKDGDFVGRDKFESHNVIKTGDTIGSTGVGVGSNVIVNVTQGGAQANLSQAFASLYASIQQIQPQNQAEALGTVLAMQKEAEKSEQAKDSNLSQLMDRLLALAPEVAAAMGRTFTDPRLSSVMGPASREILERIAGR